MKPNLKVHYMPPFTTFSHKFTDKTANIQVLKDGFKKKIYYISISYC